MTPQLSESWAQAAAPSNRDGLAMLDRLEQACTPSQRRSRQQAFPRMRRFIDSARGAGLSGNTRRSYSDPGQPNSYRVDLEVISGMAFA